MKNQAIPQMLPGIEPGEKDLTEIAMAMPLGVKVDKAVENLRHYVLLGGKFEGGFSGGKDSCVIRRLAERAGVGIEWVYNQTCIDPPELIWFMREHHGDVRWRLARRNFFTEVAHQGLPTRRNRWCCRLYKERETEADIMLFGLRKAEGTGRGARVKLFQPWGGEKRRYALNPLAYWRDEDVWAFIYNEGIPYCLLYDERDDRGEKLLDRIGCVGCPSARKQRVRQFRRWPRFEAAWRRAATRYWETHDNATIRKCKTPEAFFEWWLSDRASEDSGCQMGLF